MTFRKFFKSFVPDSAVTVHETDDSVVAVLVIEKSSLDSSVNIDVLQAELSNRLTSVVMDYLPKKLL